MNADRFQRVTEAFERACVLPPEAWSRFAHDEFPDDPAARDELLDLLDRQENDSALVATGAGLFAVASAIPSAAGPARTPSPRHLLPTLRGDYRILRTIGEGGMGVVFEAQQAFPRRRVALKAIRPGLASDSILRRFRNEADFLAKLQHPNIAQIYEAGIPDEDSPGHAYLVMEFVQGSPITEHVAQQSLPTADLLRLFAMVCDAVHHAHQRGVIHRDLKPANILVDASGYPKILDFGVARLAEPDAELATIQTQAGQLIGTLAYMSPEQVAGDPGVDHRTDVYALGVLLYQLLAGAVPIDVYNCSLPEAVRRIREQPAPSLRDVRHDLKGDIEAIVGRALEKSPDRRYQSASSLAEDLRRHLAGDPITARQDSAVYVLRKGVRRYQAAVVAASISALALAAFSVYAWRQSRSEAIARANAQTSAEEATRQRSRADERAVQLADQLRVAQVERGRLLGQGGNLHAAETALWTLHLRTPTPQSSWALWDLYSRMPCLATMPGHQAEAWALCVSDDGARFASGDESGCVLVRDTASGRILAQMRSTAPVRALAFLPGADAVVICLANATVSRWSVAAQSPLGRVLIPGDAISAGISFDPPGGSRSLALACRDGSTRVLDAATLQVIRTLEAGPRPLTSIGADASGAVLAAGDDRGSLHLFLADHPRIGLQAESGPITSVAVSRDGSILASGGGPSSRWIRTWRVDPAGSPPIPLGASRWNNGTARSLEFSPDAATILAAGYHRFEILSSDTCAPVPGAPRFSQASQRAARVPGTNLILALERGDVRLWRDADDTFTTRAAAHPGGATTLASSGRRVYSGGADAAICAWDLRDDGTLVQAFTLSEHAAGVRSLSLDREGHTLASVGTGPQDGRVLVWNLRERRMAREFLGSARPAFAAQIAPDASWIAATTRSDPVVRVWNVASGQLVATLDSGSTDSTNLAITDDGATLVSCHFGLVVAWDTRSWTRIGQATLADGPWTACGVPGSTHLAIGTWLGSLSLWDPRTGSVEDVPASHTQLVSRMLGAALAPPGIPGASPEPVIVSASTDGSICFADPASGLPLASLRPLPDQVSAITLADDRFLIAAMSDGTLGVLDLRAADRVIEANRPPAPETPR